jgi:hypothetical protein
MDRYGNGQQIVLDKVFDSVARTPSFRNFNMDLFRGGFTVTLNLVCVFFYGKNKGYIC